MTGYAFIPFNIGQLPKPIIFITLLRNITADKEGRCQSDLVNSMFSLKADKMTKIKLKPLYIALILLCFVGSNSTLDQQLLEDFDTRNVMVRFNPYVSVLDQYNKSRYGPADLIPLIEKVATRFDKVHIRLSRNDWYVSVQGQKSLVESPFAVALYNCLATTKKKVEVYLEFWHVNALPDILSLADEANTACNGTVVSLIINMENRYHFIDEYADEYKTYLNQHSKFNYSFGVSVLESEYCDFVSNFTNLLDVLLLSYEPDGELLSRDPDVSCEPYNVTKNFKKPVKLITSFYLEHDSNDLVINITRFVTKWRYFLTLSSDIYLISFAFDYYYFTHYLPVGWWNLLKDSGNTNTSGYVFEEKISVAKNFEFKEGPKNFQWLKQKHRFDENTTGIVSMDKDFNSIFDAFKHFCRVMDLYEKVPNSHTHVYIKLNSKRIKEKGFLETCLNYSVYHFTIFKMEENVSFSTLEERLSHLYENGPIKISVYTLGDTLKTHYGYVYPLRVCGQYRSTTENSEHLANKMNEPSVEVVLFYFYEEEYSVRFGATNLVRQRIVLFENCKKLVNSIRNTSLQIAFVSLGYYRVYNFYSSPLAIQNYVKYAYLLENWAKTLINTIVFIGQFKDEEIILQEDDEKHVVGWISSYPNTGYISKREEALKLSMLHYPKPVYNITEIVKIINLTTTVFERANVTTSPEESFLTGSLVFLVAGISLVIFLVIIVMVFFFMCHCYKNDNVTNAELGIFLNGDDQSDNDAHKIPYDKEKYEINEKNFQIESEVPLGAGEFGAVYRGTIDQTSGKLQVAVKTSNPQKIHKTQLTGLLSEIKVLAYIGTHANITELLGANTESLKKGKVYIFLEFCHLGSLQKYLQEMRVLVSSPIQETNVDAVMHGNIYTNAGALKQTTLDHALSQDLYRWSTEISNGMAFLAEKHVVHADLATRNVLLNLRREAKICDFGLSRRMYNYTNYVKTQQEPLPWKWMAPESLRDMIFNERTDVWAYGVTLWEIYYLATNPYAGLSWDANFSEMLERGLRLSKPVYCEGDMYERMQRCWNIFPDNRPTFSEILIMMQSSSDDEETNE